MFKVDFGMRLRMARKAKGLTADQLAEMVDIKSGEYYSKYERAERMPPPEMIVKLCNALDTTPNYLFFDSLETVNNFEDKISALQAHERKIFELMVDELLNSTSRLVQFENLGREDMKENLESEEE